MTDQPSSLRQRIDAISDDPSTPVGQLRDMVSHFVAERDWRQFHAPKNISMALAIEAAELMEHFQWITVEASRAEMEPDKRAAIGEEIADVMCYAMALCNEMNFDIATLMREKMKKNVLKYPADEFRGRYGKEDPPKEA
ncbi:nucleotide pyrophosphohydrolase [Bremerella sp. JC817]|uniref:nucleotide pyrophosphohydrolase n=1 Tax=Bremerella sp. JC817 TaxID=3231756 RepID=UPI0034591A0F